MIPYSRQDISDEDVRAVVDTLRSDWLTQGPAVEQFEQQLSRYTGAGHCVAVSNGTAALHLACMALGLGEGDYLWTSPISFVASANCGLYCGATVDFIDIDPATANLCPQQLEDKLNRAKQSGTLPKIVVVVHMAGQPCDMDSIRRLSKEYEFAVIEDASHAVGASYRGQKIGAGDFSDLTVFSFHPVKIMTTGEGGAVLGNNASLMARVKQLREHGITRDADAFESEAHGGWYYEQQALGWNYRLTDLQAALGSTQLKRLDEFVIKRNQRAEMYREAFSESPCEPLTLQADVTSSYHLFIIQVDEQKRRKTFDYLRQNDVGCQIHYIPIHTQPYYRRLGFDWGQFPLAERYYRRALSIPLYPALTGEQQMWVVSLLNESLR